jgi:hypothetical protein
MAIEQIPQIAASFSSNGFVYSIDFQKTFSSEPSKVTYKVVNKTGRYIEPTIEADASINFSNFNFNGYVYSYDIEESNSGNILTVTLVDKSVILDKLYVTVFRPGIFGKNGTSKTVSLDVVFDPEDEFYTIASNGQGYKIVKNKYTNGKVDRKVRSFSGKTGDIIIVGSEEPPETNCELPACSYTFDDLKGITGVSGFSNCPISDKKIRQTYEGTLRSVLNSWCQDFGYSFYWNYSSNSLVFFDVKNNVFSIPKSVTDSKIVSKRYSKSAEGKYNQIATNYFAKPYTPKTASAEDGSTYYGTYSLNPYNIEYFIDRTLVENQTTIYGGGRTKNEFIASAALGYVSPSLRKIYNYSWITAWGSQVGFSGTTLKYLAVSKLAVAMNSSGMKDDVKDLIAFSGSTIENLDSSYVAIMSNYDAGLEDRWTSMEQDIFTAKIGNFYRCPPMKSGSSVFCSKNMIVNTSISLEPEGSILEDQDNKDDGSANFNGRLVFSRGAPGPQITSMEALESLGIKEDASKNLDKLLPLQISILSGSKLATSLVSSQLASVAELSQHNTIMIIPRVELVSDKLKFSTSYATGSNNRESTYIDVQNNQDPDPPKCSLEDQNAKKCPSGKEELSKKQEDAKKPTDFQPKKPTSGLLSKALCVGANISINSKTVKILSSSASQYRGIIEYTTSVNMIEDATSQESIVFSLDGSLSPSNKIIETRLIVENRTTSENLSKKKPTPQELSTRKGYLQNNNIEKVSYICAGFVPALPLDSSSGLENLDMSISDSGFSASYSYSTRPAVFPSQDSSVIKNSSSPSRPANQIR